MENYSYIPKPQNFTRCIICGEEAANDLIIGGKRAKGGTACAHLSCWEKEQSELKKKYTEGDDEQR